jgi:hypothetical protein
MEKHYKHCVIDFKNKIIKTYNTNTLFTYDKFEHKYLIDVTMTHTDEGIRILGTQIFRCYTDKPIKLSEIGGVVAKRCIKKCGTSKLEKWLGFEEYEYVEGEYYVKYNNDVTIFNIPKNIIDMFIFEHTTNKESQE